MTQLSGVMVCVPSGGNKVEGETLDSLYALAQQLTTNKIPNQLCRISASDIAEVRNAFLTTWYDGHPRCSHLLFTDADMHFSPLMVRDMIAYDKPLVGCYYAKRHYPLEAVGNSLSDDDRIENIDNGFIEVKAVGCGVMLIRRDCIEQMLEKLPEIIDDGEKSMASLPFKSTLEAYGGKRLLRAFDPVRTEDGVKLSEDMSFCHRWRAAGGKVYANVEHVVGHIGQHSYAIRYADYLENKKDAA